MNDKIIKEKLKKLDLVKFPDKDKILAACGDVQVEKKKNNEFVKTSKPMFAICITLFMVLVGVSIYGIVIEAREYKEAVDFFEEYNLSMEGLTRGEIKEVYHDITTGQFESEKTVEVISKRVEGYSILQQEPTPEDVEAIWNKIKNMAGNNEIDDKGVSYTIDNKYKLDDELGFEIMDKCIVSKYDDGNLIWSTEFKDLLVEECVGGKNVSVIYGSTDWWSSEQDRYAWIAAIDNNGNVMWQHILDNGFGYEDIRQVIVDEEYITAFGMGDFDYMCMSKYDMKGERVTYTKTDLEGWFVSQTVKLGDGYLMKINSNEDGERILKLDGEGNPSDYFGYSSEKESYVINDMFVYEEKVYLSGYAMPKLEDEHSSEIYRIIDEIQSSWQEKQKDGFLELDDYLIKLLRDNYTAVLFVCEPKQGTPQVFYSIDGSFGGELKETEDGKLLWKVESIVRAVYSPFLSSWGLQGSCSVFEYTFDANGTIIGQEKTNEVTAFGKN